MEKKQIPEVWDEKKILIVDDDPVTLKMLEKILLSAGYCVAKATNGKEALYIADDFLPNLIMLDIDMPVMDGTETIERLRENPRTKNIPVIFLSSLITNKDEMGKFAKNMGYLAKPIDREKLLKEIDKHLEKS